MHAAVNRYLVDESAVDLIEYSFLVGFLAVGCLLAMSSLSDGLNALFSSVVTRLSVILP